MLKLGNSLQGMFMLGPKPLSMYDSQLKHGLGYLNPYTLKQEISQCTKLYLASSLSNSEIPLNVRDIEETLDDASKSQQKMKEKMNEPIVVANKQNCWTIDYKQIMPYKDFVPQKEHSVETQNIFHLQLFILTRNTNAQYILLSSRIIAEKIFQKDIKEMKDVFESTESELCEIKKQNDFFKDQLLEASLKHEVEISVLLNHKCVNNSLHAEIEQIKKNYIQIQEGLQAKIKILEKDVQRCQKQSVDFELKLQHEKEKHKWESNLNNKNRNPLDYFWISKMKKLENENVSLEFQVQSLIKERDNAKLEYQKLFDSIKKTRSQSQKEMDELIDHVSEKIYAYGAIRAENQNILSTISELKTRLETVEKVNAANADKAKTLALSTTSRTPKSSNTTYVVLKTRFSEKLTQSKSLDTTFVVSKPNIDVGSASKAKHKVVQIVLWIVDSGCLKHMTGDRSLLRNFMEKFMGTVCFGNDNFAAITCYGNYIQGNITICHVYYVEGDDLLTGGRESNLYTISISDMAASSPICLMSKATLTKLWLWHRRLSHLNFGTINDLTRLGLIDGLPKFKYGKDHLCSACEKGKSKKVSHPPKLVPSNHSKLELIHMDLCGPMRVASINGKKYILVIVAKVCKIHTNNGTEFKNATLKAYYEKLGIMQQFSIARTPQQNGVVERRNRTLVEAARIMLIFSRLPEFLWAEAFDELIAMAYEHDCLEPVLQRFNNNTSLVDTMNTPSKEDLENLFGPMFEEYFEKRPFDTPINYTAQLTQFYKDSPSTSLIIVDKHEAPPIETTSDEQTSLISLTYADEYPNQADSLDLMATWILFHIILQFMRN
ncbi:retrovirus-related pol polyprotein from transposon TNT 1-94 [Tanacetum coccineum]